ncbi:Restriction endonuclease [Psychrobacillus sp. OK028]|uniref:restriction endonuclease n=1 Tax=Psychrobacillus sp. OK028 TaxID=1884359 RepID=UPI0008911ED3|nr:restriction endonuclease [Psychrobacillus sp. OK028]SDM85919.1 Restriction endonuclease [Psychrobacillus sp. OK028]
MCYEEVKSMKFLMDKPHYFNERDKIIKNTIFSYLEIGYVPLDTGDEFEGESLILVDDCVYIVCPWIDDEFVVESFFNSIATDFKIDLEKKQLVSNALSGLKDYRPINNRTINDIQEYKKTYRRAILESEIFKETIIHLQSKSKVSTSIGFINHSEDDSSVLPYQCYVLLIDNEAIVINIFVDVYINKPHELQIDKYKYYISELEIKNNNIKINSYSLHSNKNFNISNEQISFIELHNEKLFEINNENEIRKEKKILKLIQRKALELTSEVNAKELLLNFIRKYTNDYYKDLKNHVFISLEENIHNLPKEFIEKLNLLISLFRNKEYIKNEIEDKYDVYILTFALQYASIIFYSDRFKSNFKDYIKDTTNMTLTESLLYFFEITGVQMFEINNELIHYLISKKMIIYNEDLSKQLTAINEILKEHVEITKLALFERSLMNEFESSITINMIDEMNGYEFELFIVELFTKMGFKAEVTKGSNDQGIDIIARNSIEMIGIQAKCYNIENRVTNKAVQEVYTGLNYYNLRKGIVISNSCYTESAKELAQKNDVILWDRNHLEKYLQLYF